MRRERSIAEESWALLGEEGREVRAVRERRFNGRSAVGNEWICVSMPREGWVFLLERE